MTILNFFILLVLAGLITLTVVALAEAGSLLAHALAKRFRHLTLTARSGSRQVSQTR